MFIDSEVIPEVYIGSRSSVNYAYKYYVEGDRTYFFDDRQPIVTGIDNLGFNE